MENKVRKAHEVAKELADTVEDKGNWYIVYNRVFDAMVAGTLANPLPDGAEKQPEAE